LFSHFVETFSNINSFYPVTLLIFTFHLPLTSHFPFATIPSTLGTISTTSLNLYLFSYNFFVGPNPLPLIQLHFTTPNYHILQIGLDPLILHLSFNPPFMNLFGKKKAAEPKKTVCS